MALFWALVMLMLLLISSAGLAYIRAEYLNKGRGLVASYAHVMDEQTTRIFQATDQRLQLAQQELHALTSRGQLSAAAANGMLTAQRVGQAQLSGLLVLDPQGKIIYDTEPDTAGLSLADREFFKAHLRMDTNGMFIDTPMLSRRTGRWQLTVSRAIRGPHERLEGVIVATIEPSFLESAWRAVDVGTDGSVALLRQNGTLLMHSPFVAEAIGKDWSHSPPFTTHLPMAAHGVYVDRASTDGIARTLAYRTLPATQMVLVVGASHTYLLQPWYALLQVFAAVFVIVALILAWLFYLLGRSWLQRYAAEELAQDNERTWQSMFEQSPVAQLLQLPFSTIVNVNDKFVALTGYQREELVGAIANDLGLRVEDALSARFVTTLKAQGRVTDMELHGKRRDGSQRLLLVSGVPITLRGVEHHLHSFVDVTEHRQFQEQARIDQSALAAISQGVLIAGPDRKTVSVNAAFEKLTGYSSDELVGEPCLMLQGPRTDPAIILAIRQALDDKRPFSGELLNYRKDGTPFWNALSINPVWSTDHQFACFVGVHNDVTDRKLHEQQLQLTEQVFSQGVEGITVTDANGNIIRVNRAFTKITGYSEAEVLGKNPRILQSGIQSRDYYQKMWHTLSSEGVWSGEIHNRHKDGTVYPEWLTISAIRDTNGVVTHYLGSFNDLSQAKAAESRIQRLSHFDPLTGLPNRSLLQDRTVHAISMVQRNKEPLCMMLVSIDHFKTINDTLGHHVGDDLLIEMGKRLSAAVRDQDTVSHLSGKEFVLILPDTPP